MTLTAALSNGDPLPAWLSFDAATRTLSGTPTNLDGGGFTVVITATDSNGGIGTEAITFAIGDGLILGTDGDDTLNGTNEDDVFIGGLGNDLLLGSRGDDTYIFNEGDGQDIVRELSSFNTTDTIVFNDYALADATFTNITGSSYTLEFANGDSVTVDGGTGSQNTRVELIQFTDQTLNLDQILVARIAAQVTDGDDVVLGSGLAETLFGGLGNDTLEGGAGDDR